MALILALDQGTTSSRAILFNEQGRPVESEQLEFTQHFPKPGWVEHDATEIWETQLQVARAVLERAEPGAVRGIGVTNQRETTVIWDRATGSPIAPAIVWQDRRTAETCEKLRADGAANLIAERTGLVLDAYFSATKITWILDHVDGARERANAGELAFGTIETWLIWNLTRGAEHVTDPSNASRTLLFDIKQGAWSDEMLELFRVPRALLPDLVPNSGVAATTDRLGPQLPIAGIAGDQQAALFGQQCTDAGQAKCTYGTGCFLLLNTGATPVSSSNNLLSTVAWGNGDQLTYALEGSVFIGGAVVQWLRDSLGIIKSSSDIEDLAASVDSADGVVFVPAFAGLGAPHWDAYARGTIVGLTRGSTAAHIARAALDAIAFQVADLVDAMRLDAGIALSELRVDGGACANNLLLQTQADLLGLPVVRPKVIETTALGAARFAAEALSAWPSTGESETVDRVFEPAIDRERAHSRRALWRRAVDRAREWEPHS